MKNFRSTLIFAILVGGLGAFTYYLYQNKQTQEEQQSRQERIYPDLEIKDLIQVKIDRDKGVLTLKKDKDEWVLREPIKDKGDTFIVESFLKSLVEQQANPLPIEGGVNWAEYGLEKPAATVTFITGTKEQKLLISNKQAFDGSYYLRKENDDLLYIGESDWKDLIEKPANELRNKNIFPEGREIMGFTLRRGGKFFQFTKEKDGWQLKSDPKMKIAQTKVDDFVSNVHSLSVTGFMTDEVSAGDLRSYGLDNPEVVLSAKLNGAAGDVPVEDWVLKLSPIKDSIAYALTNYKGTAYRVSKSTAERFQKELVDFRDRSYPFVFEGDKVAAVAIRDGDRVTEFKKVEGKWMLTTPQDGKAADSEAISRLIDNVQQFKAEDFLGSKRASQLKRAKHQLVLRGEDGQAIFELKWSGTYTVGSGDDQHELYFATTNFAGETLSLKEDDISKMDTKQLVKSTEEKTNESADGENESSE